MNAAFHRWHVLIPVKALARAKSRLAAVGDRRPDVALAFARDTALAALRCEAVSSVTVVTDDPMVAWAMRADGALILAEGSVPELNGALASAFNAMADVDNVAVLLGDLPALTPATLACALILADLHATAFVPDARGTGTTLLTGRTVAAMRPRFGPGSASAHAKAGAVRLESPRLERLRTDVDDLADLREATRLGVGYHTRRVLHDLDPRTGWFIDGPRDHRTAVSHDL